MRILLINPPSPEQLGSPLLGLQYVAASLLAHGCEVRVIDAAARYFPHDSEWIAKEAEAFHPRIIGFSLFTRWVWHAYGLVERLPSSAYPEPVIRGLYGSSLWLDMQGLQWPYYPRIGVGISGYGWVDIDFKRTRIGDPGQSEHTTLLFGQGRFAARITPTYTNGSWFVLAQAELIANLNQLDAQPTDLAFEVRCQIS